MTGDDDGALVYAEGDIFRVSDRMVGVVTRCGSDVACCHFFHASIPESAEPSLDPKTAVGVVRVDDKLLRDGTWPIIGTVSPWSRTTWEMPPFGVYWDDFPAASLTVYSDDDVANVVGSERVDLETAKKFPVDRLCSAEAIEFSLTAPLSEDAMSTKFPDTRTDREVRAFFAIPTDGDVEALITALETDGWKTRHASPQESPDSGSAAGQEVIAWKFLPGVPEYAEIERTRLAAEALAAQLGATMDGWEIELG